MLCYFLNYSFILCFLLILFYFCFLNSVEADKGGMRKKERDPRALPQDNFIITTSGFFFSLSFCLVCLKQMLIWEERNLCLVRNDCHWNWWDDEKKLVQIQLKFLSCLLKCAIFIIFIWESLLTVVTVCDPSKFHWNVCLCVFMRNDQKVWTFEL